VGAVFSGGFDSIGWFVGVAVVLLVSSAAL
jgi:hypothetical protein